ncbi:hypothetical protein ACHAWO_006152 [Cyclotella atomus]|jgi:hypothetical protein|uniref:Uncharacterized protein n=1 Tax=Cyclotella atomus TaxID=382360 RepID=A0ABD3PGA5_9STRA
MKPLKCKMRQKQTQKKAEGMEYTPIEKVLEAVRNEYGYAPSTTTVYNDIKVGRIGEPPKERGAKPEYFARKKVEAWESYLDEACDMEQTSKAWWLL